MADLDYAIVVGRKAVELCPQEHPDRPKHLNGLAYYLNTRYKYLGAEEDLEDAIILGREALDLCPEGHPSRSKYLHNLADDLALLYELRGVVNDLDEAISLGREALDLCSPGHADRLMRLKNFVNDLFKRYWKLRAMTDQEDAIILGREFLDLCPQGDPARLTHLIYLAFHLIRRYERLGDIIDVEESIILGREAHYLCPPGHPNKTAHLTNLVVNLWCRFNQSGAMPDLDEAISVGWEILDVCPPGHPNRDVHLGTLADDLFKRYERLGEMTDLDSVIDLTREALDLRAHGHRYRFDTLDNLAFYLSTRYHQLRAITDLEDTILLRHEILGLCPPGHPDRSASLRNLATELSNRHKELGMIADLDNAILLAREALELHPSGHPSRSLPLDQLAGYLRSRFIESNQLEDQQGLFDLYAELTDLPEVVYSSDLVPAKAWANAAEDFHHPTTVLAYQTYLQLLVRHVTTSPSSFHRGSASPLEQLTLSLTADAFSACLRNDDPLKAVELLEQGCVVFWNQLCCLRSPLYDVIASSPAAGKLADEFTRLTSLFHDTVHPPCPDQLDHLGRLDLAIKEIVYGIRDLPGLEHFLLPLPSSDLRRAAIGGPLIIMNASHYSCDALVILVDRDPIHVPLQITKLRVRELSSEFQWLTMDSNVVDVTRDLGQLLRELWDQVISPIVDVLRSVHRTRSRIWWCPTAEFSHLPLHAAGPYRRDQPNLSDLYTSSYTPTLSALIRARRPQPPDSEKKGRRLLAIGREKALEEGELTAVDDELAAVGQRVHDPATFMPLRGPESTVSHVSEELKKHEWVHLACDSTPAQTDPFGSAFVFQDGFFTVQDILGCELENAGFAYLSACREPVTVGDESEGSPEEAIQLASGMLLAGFRSVVGTMWSADDGTTNEIVSTFYKHVTDASGCLDYTRAAQALNETMNALADVVPLDQRVLYVHVGA